MTYTDILNAVISHKHGGMVAEQFRNVVDGDPIDDQNPSAVRDIVATLAEITQSFPESDLGSAAEDARWMFR